MVAGTTVRWGIQRRVTHPTLALGIAPKRPTNMRVISDKWPPGLGWSGRRREWKQGVSTSPPPAGLQVHPPSSSQTSTVVGALDQLAPQKPWVFRPVSPAAAHQDSPLGAPQDSPWGPLRTAIRRGWSRPGSGDHSSSPSPSPSRRLRGAVRGADRARPFRPLLRTHLSPARCPVSGQVLAPFLDGSVQRPPPPGAPAPAQVSCRGPREGGVRALRPLPASLPLPST